jgi:hypothetical protein
MQTIQLTDTEARIAKIEAAEGSTTVTLEWGGPTMNQIKTRGPKKGQGGRPKGEPRITVTARVLPETLAWVQRLYPAKSPGKSATLALDEADQVKKLQDIKRKHEENELRMAHEIDQLRGALLAMRDHYRQWIPGTLYNQVEEALSMSNALHELPPP